MKISTDAKKIAKIVYPEDWIENSSIKGFKHDNNVGRRACAEDVAEHFLKILKEPETIDYVLLAFYRRVHGTEPKVKDMRMLRTHMGTALLAYEQQLKRPIGGEV